MGEEENMNIRSVFERIMADVDVPNDLSEQDMLRILVELMSEPTTRAKLPHFNTLDDVLKLVNESKRVLVVTGAGVSVSCGIPDFRSKNGIYARLHADFPDLPDPQSMFDIDYFKKNPKPFFDFAREIYPGQFKPSLSHKFIKLLETNDQLLRNYTQNIDTLEQVAGIHRVVQCHGSFATASCCACKHQVDAEFIRKDIMDKNIPRCPICSNQEENFCVLKPDITFFGEPLPKEFHDRLEEDKGKADLLIVIGSSMKVRPVSLIPNLLPQNVPQILINREPLSHLNFDVELLGNCDEIIHEICRRLGEPWNALCAEFNMPPLAEISETDLLVEKKNLHATNAGLKNDAANTLSEMYKPRMQKMSNCLREPGSQYEKVCRTKTDSNCSDDTFLFSPPSRYIFKGAEVFKEYDTDSESEPETEHDSERKSESELPRDVIG